MKSMNKLLLSDFLATKQVTVPLMEYLSVNTERELIDTLGCDFYYLSCRDISQNESCLPFYKGPKPECTKTERKCPLGIRWKRKVFDDKFGVDEVIDGPLMKDNIEVEDIQNFRFPEPEWFDFSPLADECNQFKDKIIVGGLWSGIHGDSYRMMGYENFLINIAVNRHLIKTLVNRMTDFYLTLNRHYFEVVKGRMDVFFMGNDFGSQSGLMISLDDWKDIYFNNYKKLIDQAHGYDLKVMVHSCGSIEPLLPFFIELGVDIIDPVQTSAKGMDPVSLVRKYGKDLYFHGAIDTQSVLPFGSTRDVKSHVLEMVSKLNEYQQYIVVPSNNFMPGTPPQNIKMVYSTIQELNKQ